MWVDEEGIEAAFNDITELAVDCRFNDCVHLSEPGCAVLAAIAAGTLPSERLDSYRKLLGEAAFAAEKNDVRLAKEAQKLSKQRTTEGRRSTRPRTGPARCARSPKVGLPTWGASPCTEPCRNASGEPSVRGASLTVSALPQSRRPTP